ncbi:MAG: hypothetical protein ACRD5R_13075, partial [Candidatus Acidiferrales bacterium]
IGVLLNLFVFGVSAFSSGLVVYVILKWLLHKSESVSALRLIDQPEFLYQWTRESLHHSGWL